jgi:hypothetical protein
LLILPEETSADPGESRASRLWTTVGSRLLFWLSAAALATGSVVLLVTLLREEDPPGPLPPQPTVTTENRTAADIDPAARRVAGEFILTAVARKNVAKSWAITHPSLRDGYTKAEWSAGDIPIIPYAVDSIDEARFSIDHLAKDLIQLDVALLPKNASQTAGVFTIGLVAVGTGNARRWLVDYWGPAGAPGFRAAPR